MRWHNERITEEVNDVWYLDGELRGSNVGPIMQKMRDDYEQALINQRAESIKLAQQVTELEAQLAAALATIERAASDTASPDGALYAEGCAP